MKRFLLALLLAAPLHLYSQAIPFEQRGPLVSITASAVSITHYDQNGHNRTLWGWSATPEVNITRRIGLQADVANSYMKSVFPGQTRLIIAGGPRYNFKPVSRLSPFVFAEAGGIKLTPQGKPAPIWDPLVTLGLGAEYRLTPRFAITLIPAEYLGQKAQEDNNTWTHSFAARGGFTFNFSPLSPCEHRPRCWIVGH